MLLRSKTKIALVLVPFALFGVLFLLLQRRPRPLPGTKGPAGVSGLPVSIVYSPSGDLYCASNDGNVQRYLPEQKRFRSLGMIPDNYLPAGTYTHGTVTSRLFFSRDGKKVFVPQSGFYNPSVTQIVDSQTRRATAYMLGPQTPAFALSGDEKWMALGMSNGLLLLDLNKNKPRLPSFQGQFQGQIRPKIRLDHPQFYNTSRPISCADFSPDSRTLAIGYNGQIALFDVDGDFKTPRSQSALNAGTSFGSSMGGSMGGDDPFWLAWSPSGTKLAVFSSNEIGIYDASLQKLASAKLPFVGSRGFPVTSQAPNLGANLVWTKDEKTLLSGGDEVRRWETDGLKLVASYGVSGPVALSPDGKTMITSSKMKPGDYPSFLQWKVG